MDFTDFMYEGVVESRNSKGKRKDIACAYKYLGYSSYCQWFYDETPTFFMVSELGPMHEAQ